MKPRTNQNKIVNALRSTKGRFFGLTTTQGNQVNARFVGETPSYVRVYDRNRDNVLTIAKSSLAAVRCGKTEIA
jgi:hypothetical protein